MANVFASFGSLGQKISLTQGLGSGVKKGVKKLD